MRILKLLVLSFIGLFVSLETAFAYPHMHLSGPWFHNGQLVTIQERFHQNYILCNEENDCAKGFVNFPGNIVVPQWGVTGNIQAEGNSIYWSNNTVWSRNNYQPFEPTPMGFNTSMLNGQWFHDGQAVFIRTNGRGQLFITNEVRQTVSGYIEGPGIIFIPSLGLRGELNHHQDKIRWSNNTVWRR